MYFSAFICDLFSLIRMNAAVLEISDTALNEMTFSFSSNAFLSSAFTCYCHHSNTCIQTLKGYYLCNECTAISVKEITLNEAFLIEIGEKIYFENLLKRLVQIKTNDNNEYVKQ